MAQRPRTKRGPKTDALFPRTVFRALADPNRAMILERLAACRRPCRVTELAACCPVDLSVVSRHLAVLRDAGILAARRQGKEVFYRIRSETLVRTLRRLADALECCCDPERKDRASPRRPRS